MAVVAADADVDLTLELLHGVELLEVLALSGRRAHRVGALRAESGLHPLGGDGRMSGATGAPQVPQSASGLVDGAIRRLLEVLVGAATGVGGTATAG